VLAELTYFWGLTGTFQAVITPDLSIGFPHLLFFQYVLGHLGIVLAALFLVAGMGIHPRSGSVARVFAITAGYTAFVGLIDGLTGANYMFLRQPPGRWTLLTVMGPWPWYLVSAAAAGLVLLILLDAPFWHGRHASGASGEPGAAGEEQGPAEIPPAQPVGGSTQRGPGGARQT
jgi:hypothetical integral membrane protein (TIGR02206 family)